jgi:SAM-dependent methyltransferase
MLKQFVREFMASVRTVGLGYTLRLLPSYLRMIRVPIESLSDPLESEDRFDEVYGTDTLSPVRLDEMDRWKPDHAMYRAAPRRIIRAALSSIDIEFGQTTFVDLGCGKARVLLVASEYPFKEIIGVEYSRDLANVGTSNIAVYKGREKNIRCTRMSVHCGDAREFPIPDGEVLFFCYEPFRASVLISVFDRIRSSLRADPRKITMLWVGHMRPFACPSWLRCTEVGSGARGFHIFAIRPR